MNRLLKFLLIPLLATCTLIPLPFAGRIADAALPKKGTNYAFMIAGARYTHLQPIEGEETINDILEFKKALLETGFDEANIVLMHDRQAEKGGAGARFLPEYDKILKELDLFLDGMKPEDTVLVVLSGHGVLFKGEKSGYFCPVDAKLDPKTKLIPMDGPGSLYSLLEKCKAGRKLLISNTCRNAPSVARRDDLAGDKVELIDDYPEKVPVGIAAFYSCEAGQRSYFDQKRGRSLFFIHLTEAWRGKYQSSDGPLTLESVFENTRVKTKADANATKGEKQFPVVRRQYEGEWTIGGGDIAMREPKAGELRKFAVADKVFMEFCYIPTGTTQLGSPKTEVDGVMKEVGGKLLPQWLAAEEERVRPKYTTNGFWLGKYEVTQAEWVAVMGDNPSWFTLDGRGKEKLETDKITATSRFPVENVSWNMICKPDGFLERVNKRPGSGKTFGNGKFVLPHEDEWEYACRGGKGNKQPFYWGDELDGTQANCHATFLTFGTDKQGVSLGRPCTVDETSGGKYEKHPWGLQHMLGNISEWCENEYSKGFRAARGGAWSAAAHACRAAYRDNSNSDYTNSYVGFRVCYRLER